MIKDVVLCSIKDLKQRNLDEAYLFIESYRIKHMGVVVTNGKNNSFFKDAIFIVKDLYLDDKNVYGNLTVVDFKYNFINDLETYEGIFYKKRREQGSIKFIPKEGVDGKLSHFELDNKFSNPKKVKEDLLGISLQNKVLPLEDGDMFLDINVCYRLPHNFKGDLREAVLDFYKSTFFYKNQYEKYNAKDSVSKIDNWEQSVNLTGNPLFGDIKVKKIQLDDIVDVTESL